MADTQEKEMSWAASRNSELTSRSDGRDQNTLHCTIRASLILHGQDAHQHNLPPSPCGPSHERMRELVLIFLLWIPATHSFVNWGGLGQLHGSLSPSALEAKRKPKKKMSMNKRPNSNNNRKSRRTSKKAQEIQSLAINSDPQDNENTEPMAMKAETIDFTKTPDKENFSRSLLKQRLAYEAAERLSNYHEERQQELAGVAKLRISRVQKSFQLGSKSFWKTATLKDDDEGTSNADDSTSRALLARRLADSSLSRWKKFSSEKTEKAIRVSQIVADPESSSWRLVSNESSNEIATKTIAKEGEPISEENDWDEIGDTTSKDEQTGNISQLWADFNDKLSGDAKPVVDDELDVKNTEQAITSVNGTTAMTAEPRGLDDEWEKLTNDPLLNNAIRQVYSGELPEVDLPEIIDELDEEDESTDLPDDGDSDGSVGSSDSSISHSARFMTIPKKGEVVQSQTSKPKPRAPQHAMDPLARDWGTRGSGESEEDKKIEADNDMENLATNSTHDSKSPGEDSTDEGSSFALTLDTESPISAHKNTEDETDTAGKEDTTLSSNPLMPPIDIPEDQPPSTTEPSASDVPGDAQKNSMDQHLPSSSQHPAPKSSLNEPTSTQGSATEMKNSPVSSDATNDDNENGMPEKQQEIGSTDKEGPVNQMQSTELQPDCFRPLSLADVRISTEANRRTYAAGGRAYSAQAVRQNYIPPRRFADDVRARKVTPDPVRTEADSPIESDQFRQNVARPTQDLRHRVAYSITPISYHSGYDQSPWYRNYRKRRTLPDASTHAQNAPSFPFDTRTEHSSGSGYDQSPWYRNYRKRRTFPDASVDAQNTSSFPSDTTRAENSSGSNAMTPKDSRPKVNVAETMDRVLTENENSSEKQSVDVSPDCRSPTADHFPSPEKPVVDDPALELARAEAMDQRKVGYSVPDDQSRTDGYGWAFGYRRLGADYRHGPNWMDAPKPTQPQRLESWEPWRGQNAGANPEHQPITKDH